MHFSTTTSSLLSAICSALIIFVIFRAETKLSSTYYRIMFGMSAVDIVGSIATALSTIPSPKNLSEEELSEILFSEGPRWGNEITCKAQGFSFLFGVLGTYFYNVSLCIYYACAIVFQIDRIAIQQKWGAFFHIIPILTAFSCAILPFIFKFKRYHFAAFCIPYLTDCDHNADCDETIHEIASIFYVVVASSCLVTMTICLGLVIAKAVKLDKQFRENEIMTVSDADLAVISERHQNAKATTIQALAYITSFIVTIGFLFFTRFGITQLDGVFIPLQGVFNFIIFIGHKIYNYRWVHKDVGYCTIIHKIFCSSFSDPVLLSRITIVENDAMDRDLARSVHVSSAGDDDPKNSYPEGIISGSEGDSLFGVSSGVISGVISHDPSGGGKSGPSNKNISFAEPDLSDFDSMMMCSHDGGQDQASRTPSLKELSSWRHKKTQKGNVVPIKRIGITCSSGSKDIFRDRRLSVETKLG